MKISVMNGSRTFRTSSPKNDVCKFANYNLRFGAEPVAKIILGLKLKRPPLHDKSISSVGKIVVNIID